MELQMMTTNQNNGATHPPNERLMAGNGDGVAGNGDGVAYRIPDAAEEDVLLHVQTSGHNGEKLPISRAENQRNIETRSVCRIKRELNEVVFWRVRVWMVIAAAFLLLFAVILTVLSVCTAVQEDVDDYFDPSSFRVPLYFDGNFQMPNLAFAEELLLLSSNESQALVDVCQEKLADLYSSSPALGRYFSKAEIYAFRNDSVIADYQLTFLLPEDQQDQLRNFTLSREMVYNVFRQFLYDQEADESEPTYIDPVSLSMFLRHQ